LEGERNAAFQAKIVGLVRLNGYFGVTCEVEIGLDVLVLLYAFKIGVHLQL
jgi:hypothetical protein